MRPSHWLKNGFVFAPLIFSKTLFEEARLVPAVLAFLAFCLASSAIYVINDIADRKADAAHPTKKNRPIASRRVSLSSALVQLFVITGGAAALALELPWPAAVLIAVYFALNLGYSLGLKHVVILDVFIIAAGFMIRVLTGAFAIDVPISDWIIICTLFLSLFLGVAKRRSELNNVERGASRKVLDDYTPELIRTMMIVSVAGSIMTYTLYTVSDHVVTVFGTRRLIYTVPIVMFGLFRYLYLDEKKQTAENPVAVVARDPSLLLTALAWLLAAILIIYGKHLFPDLGL